jgi:agmatine/peptidylarginine deiminase
MDWETDTVLFYWPTDNIFYFLSEDTHANENLFEKLGQILHKDGVTAGFIKQKLPSIWIRDYFPITIDGKRIFFRPCEDYMTFTEREIYDSVDFQAIIKRFINGNFYQSELLLDGGNIIFNDKFVLTSEKVLKDNRNLAKSEISYRLRNIFNGREILYLQTEKKDRTGHVDGIAAFLANDVVLLNDWSEEQPKLDDFNRKILGDNFEVVPFPHFDTESKYIGWYNIAGNYINFINTTKSLVFSTFGDEAMEKRIKRLITKHDPLQRPIHFINSDCVNKYGGGLHCVSWNYARFTNE